ncbi:MAG: hypothetical protein ACLP3K_17795 [Candidatus Acidiferrales bacterium]
MQTRKRIAQALASLGSLILFVGASLHSTLGYRAIFGPLQGTTAPPENVQALKTIWVLYAWHSVAIGIVALLAAFVRGLPHRAILLVCGIITLGDATGTYAALGAFIGDEISFSCAVALLAAAALFPSEQH